MIFSQVLFIIYAMFLPVSFILSMIPSFDGMSKRAITKLFNTILTRAGITLIITTAFSISTMLYTLSAGYPFFLIAFLQIVTFAGIYFKLGDLMSMFSLQSNDSQSVGSRVMRSLKGYLTDELQALNVDTVRKDIPVSSSVRGFQIWTVEPTGDNEFNVTYSVDQLITEGENTKTVHSAYIVSVYVDGSGNMVLVKNPTITNIPKKSSYKPKAIESEGTVDSITTNEINEFLTTFFKLYPTATASELSYYVNDGILKPIGKEYIFQELVNPIHNRKDNQVTVSLTVEYIDQQTKATQVSQFDLVLEKNGSNWKIIE